MLFLPGSPLWANAPTSHLAHFKVVQSKAIHTNGISMQEADSKAMSLSYWWQVGGISILYNVEYF